MTEGLILAILLCVAISLAGYRLRSLPVTFIGSLGWMISGLQVYQQSEELLPMALMLFIAFVTFFLHVPEAER